MAGGRSTRMRATAGPTHKAMIDVAGSSLIERNVRQLISFGFRRLAVVVSSDESALRDYVLRRIVPIAVDSSVRLDVCLESKPLGNIGFVGTIADVDDVLVTYVDNLTTLDARRLVAHHRETANDLTIAVHEEPIPVPYGVLKVDGARVLRYDEKPDMRCLISSGTCVVGRRARGLVPPNAKVDARDLFRLVSDAGGSVGAYRHDALWVDVNDVASMRRAEALIG